METEICVPFVPKVKRSCLSSSDIASLSRIPKCSQELVKFAPKSEEIVLPEKLLRNITKAFSVTILVLILTYSWSLWQEKMQRDAILKGYGERPRFFDSEKGVSAEIHIHFQNFGASVKESVFSEEYLKAKCSHIKSLIDNNERKIYEGVKDSDAHFVMGKEVSFLGMRENLPVILSENGWVAGEDYAKTVKDISAQGKEHGSRYSFDQDDRELRRYYNSMCTSDIAMYRQSIRMTPVENMMKRDSAKIIVCAEILVGLFNWDFCPINPIPGSNSYLNERYMEARDHIMTEWLEKPANRQAQCEALFEREMPYVWSLFKEYQAYKQLPRILSVFSDFWKGTGVDVNSCYYSK